MGRNIIKYKLIELGNNLYDFSMEPTTIKFKSKKQANQFWEKLTETTTNLASPKQRKES